MHLNFGKLHVCSASVSFVSAVRRDAADVWIISARFLHWLWWQVRAMISVSLQTVSCRTWSRPWFIYGTIPKGACWTWFHLLGTCCLAIPLWVGAVSTNDGHGHSPPLIDFQSSQRLPIAMCYCRRSVVCYCQPSTLEQSTCWHPVCLVTQNISSKADNSFISAIVPRHCFITASPQWS